MSYPAARHYEEAEHVAGRASHYLSAGEHRRLVERISWALATAETAPPLFRCTCGSGDAAEFHSFPCISSGGTLRALAEKIQQVREIHWRDQFGSEAFCNACFVDAWPCETIRALDGSA